MTVTETFHGFIETTQDVLLVFEGCRRGLLPRIGRRLQERERRMIRSGSVFVFDEHESGIKRWTDGRYWSPSRILGNFLIYREIDKKSDKKSSGWSPSPDPGAMNRNRERQLVGSLSDSFRFRPDGLIKKSMSIVVHGVSHHLVSYYNPLDVVNHRLSTPSSHPQLSRLEISPDLLVKQNFRVPLFAEESNPQRQPPPIPAPFYKEKPQTYGARSLSLGSYQTEKSHVMESEMARQPSFAPLYTHERFHQRHSSASSAPYSNSNSTSSESEPRSDILYGQPQERVFGYSPKPDSRNLVQLLNPVVHPLHPLAVQPSPLPSFVPLDYTKPFDKDRPAHQHRMSYPNDDFYDTYSRQSIQPNVPPFMSHAEP
ncbi:Gti1/Pac2 family-domain-containing protein [Phycomyces nitens]|nr:Gti1/Pac2 family-domain-containing protein [Phycomyces nitens]